jgi:hypothetical protein
VKLSGLEFIEMTLGQPVAPHLRPLVEAMLDSEPRPYSEAQVEAVSRLRTAFGARQLSGDQRVGGVMAELHAQIQKTVESQSLLPSRASARTTGDARVPHSPNAATFRLVRDWDPEPHK